MVTWAGGGLVASPAQAEPVATATYSSAASADVLGVSTNLVGLSVADLRLAHSSAGADSGTGATATSSNVNAALLGALSIPVNSSSVSVPASQSSSQTRSGSLAGVDLNLALQAHLDALSYDQQANWNGAACLPDGTYVSRGNAAAAGLAVGILGTRIVSTGDVSVTSTTGTSPSSAVHDTRRTTAVAQGRVAGLSLLNGAVTVSALDPVMSTSSGSTTATISSSAVTVTTGGSTVTLLPGQTLNLTPGIGQTVSLTLAPTSISGMAGSYGATFLKVRVSVLALATVDLDVLPLSVAAVAPSTSLECDTSASIDISSPTAGQTVTATPTISGTSDIASGTLSLVLDGRAAVPVSTDPTGAWTYNPTVPLADGARTAVVSGTDAAGNAATSSRTFTVDSTGPALAIGTPAAGATTADSTPTIGGTSDILGGASRWPWTAVPPCRSTPTPLAAGPTPRPFRWPTGHAPSWSPAPTGSAT